MRLLPKYSTLRSYGPDRRRERRPSLNLSAFTLLELLVSMALLMIVVGVTYSITSSITSAWKGHKARLSTFQGARTGFDALTSRLSQATLNTYWDYDNPNNPTRYLRQSELHFIMDKGNVLISSLNNVFGSAVFFVAPLGFTAQTQFRPLGRMLTACGFYVRFSDEVNRPSFLGSRVPIRYRYRLFQFLQPGEDLSIYTQTTGNAWFTTAVQNNSFPMVDNVIGLILRAEYPDPPPPTNMTIAYKYDSRSTNLQQSNQLPPVIKVTMVVIDEDSARRLADTYGSAAPPIVPSGSFTNPNNYDQDLQSWEDTLQNFQPKITYRIFSADIPIRGAKWSSN